MKLFRALRMDASLYAPEVVTVVGGGGKTSLVYRLAGEIVERGGRVVTATTTRITVRQVERAPASLAIAPGAPLPVSALQRTLDVSRHVMLVGAETLLNGKQSGVEASVIDSLAEQAGALGIDAILVEGDGSRTLPVKAPADHEPVVAPTTTLLLPVVGMDAVGAPLDEQHAHRPERIRSLLGHGGEFLRLTPGMAARLLMHPQGGAKALPPAARLIPVLNKAESAPARAVARRIATSLAAAGLPALIAAAGIDEREPVIERWGPLAAIVLAAGESRRFESPKQAAFVDGETLVCRAVRLALESGAQQVILVTGAHAEATRAALGDLTERAGTRLRIVHNELWQSGQASSLRAGIGALDPRTEAVTFLPVDQPFLDAPLLRLLVSSWRRGSDLVAPSVRGELRGAPALFDRRFLAELAAIEGDRGGRVVLQAHTAQVHAIAANPLALHDIDWPHDVQTQGVPASGSPKDAVR